MVVDERWEDEDGDDTGRHDGASTSVWHATNDAVRAARKAGIIGDADAGAVAVLLAMAERMDRPGFPVIGEKFDNVTESAYLKACDALGLTPASRKKIGPRKEASSGKLGVLQSGVPDISGGVRHTA